MKVALIVVLKVYEVECAFYHRGHSRSSTCGMNFLISEGRKMSGEDILSIWKYWGGFLCHQESV